MNQRTFALIWAIIVATWPLWPSHSAAGQLMAGVAKIEITDRRAGPVDGPMYVRALVLRHDETYIALITVDAVAIGEIGPIGNDYLPEVRRHLEQDLQIPSSQVVVNASHCHGIVRTDVDRLTIAAVKQAVENLVPVKVGAGVGRESRIMENRRLRLKSGKEIDVRHAYALPANDEVASVGPVDPEIGVLRLDRFDGSTVAILYNFACHPIQGVPRGANTADLTGFASKVIEDNLAGDAVALFVQGCAGDINPIGYKSIRTVPNAEALGTRLGLSTLTAIRQIRPRDDDRLKIVNRVIALPRADLAGRIIDMKAERQQLVGELQGTFLNLESFLPLIVSQKLNPEFPSAPNYSYLREQQQDQPNLEYLDSVNRARVNKYVRNVRTMEQITRINTNLKLLEKHQSRMIESGKRTIEAELTAIRVGDFVITTFPGELTVPIGLSLKQQSPHRLTFVAGYTNGYLYYAPTARQLANVGNAQEDSDCLLAPAWQQQYEAAVLEMLGGI